MKQMTQKQVMNKKEKLFFQKIHSDREWYMEKFLKIRDKRSQLIPFKVNTAQQIVMKLIKECEEQQKLKRFIVLKARQMGLSTLFEGLIFHDTSTNSFKNSQIIAHEDKATSNLFAMSKLFLDELPDVIRPMVKYSNEKALVFENPSNDTDVKQKNPGLRSKITIATAGAGEVGRSSTFHNVHASEVAFFPDAQTTLLGLLQSVPDEMNTMVVLESTANGVGDWFHEMWKKAERGENEFIPVFLPWFIDPGYTRPFRTDTEREVFIEEVERTFRDDKGHDVSTYEKELMLKHDLTYEQLNWRRYTMANKCHGDEILFMQEYPCTAEEAFISTGRPKFNISAVRKYQTKTKEPSRGYLREKDGQIYFDPDDHGYISIWEYPQEDRVYSLGADVAEGLVHGDFSCGLVGDNSSLDIVAMWHGHIDPDLFGVELVKLAKYYNYAYLGVENNNHGLTTLSSIKREEYYNIFFSKTYDKFSDTITKKLGWSTTVKTKPLMIDKLAEFIREMYLGIPSDVIISEMYTYVIEDNGKTNAQPGCNDDTIMAMAILVQLILENMGHDYAPEIPSDEKAKRAPDEIVDPLFEGNKEPLEVAL